MLQADRYKSEEYRTSHRKRNIRVDLLVLITCFSTMAAVAVPRHLNMTEAARRAELSSLARGINSASELGHRLWLAAGRPDSLETERGQLNLRHGFPSSETLTILLEQSELMPFISQNGAWQHRMAPSGDVCHVSYRPPRRLGEKPRIAVDESGC
jgi:hypothetical protein